MLIADGIVHSFTDSAAGVMDMKHIRKVRLQLEALGLIKAISKSGIAGSVIAWSMTDKGRRYLAEQRAVKAELSTPV
jgi:hypothetical protein